MRRTWLLPIGVSSGDPHDVAFGRRLDDAVKALRPQCQRLPLLIAVAVQVVSRDQRGRRMADRQFANVGRDARNSAEPGATRAANVMDLPRREAGLYLGHELIEPCLCAANRANR